MPKKKIGSEVLLDDLRRVKKKLGYDPSLPEYRENGGKYSERPFINAFGSWGNAIRSIGGMVQKGGGKLKEPATPREVYGEFLNISTKGAVILPDPHVPYHNVDLVNEMVDLAKKHKITDLIIPGDFLDFKGLYRHEPQHTKIDWTEELEIAQDFLEWISEQFKRVLILQGNHDHRFVRLLNNVDRAERLYRLLFKNPKVKFSRYQFCVVNDWLDIQHSGNTKVKLSKAEKIVSVNRRSLLVTHSHRFAMGIHDSGIEAIFEGLHGTDPKYHEYCNMSKSDYSNWISGFWVLKDDKMYPHVKHERIGNLL